MVEFHIEGDRAEGVMRLAALLTLLFVGCTPVYEEMTPDGPVTRQSRCPGCFFGFVCNEDKGLCERKECGGRCSATQKCVTSPAGEQCR